MNWDLAAILFVLMSVSGLIWLYDIIFLAPHRRDAIEKSLESTQRIDIQEEEEVPFLVDLSRSLFPVFFIVLVLRSFLVEPFRIPSGSMMPTLLVGDFILVNKFTYGIRLPILNVKVIDIGFPERGDVVVFRYPENPSIPYIKRVVGLPGDHISYHSTNKVLYINGEPVVQNFKAVYQGVGAGSNMTGAEEYIEFLPGDEDQHSILIIPQRSSQAGFNEMTVPEGEYFVLGDNRDNSRDSRYWGTVPEENLVGRAFFIWMNWDLSNGGISWQRPGTHIH